MNACFDITSSSAPALVDQASVASFADLCSFCDRFDLAMSAAGVQPGATVVSSLESDVWGAATAVASVRNWTHAPQDPSLRRPQLHERFTALGSAALVVRESSAERAVDIATAAGMAVLRLTGTGHGLGGTEIVVDRTLTAPSTTLRLDLAMVLHTSGTTSQPLMVPISHDNLRSSLTNMTDTFSLTPADRSLTVMPLHHVHSLVSSVLLPISIGASAACPGLYEAPSFLGWLTELSPSYYSAVPTVHQSILDRIASHPHELGRHRLRFVRSSASKLAERTRAGLEYALRVPVLEGYAMTETSSQITSNPLPPAPRKNSSVGPSVGPAIQIVDDDDQPLELGQTGQVWVQGPSVVSEYLADPTATATRFKRGWLKTGDSGYVDEDGYLFLTGRTGDVIQRGGESVSAAGVQASLLQHELVHEALVFGVPDSRLGHQVAAAVVADQGVDEASLREHVFRRSAPYEVPRRILVVDKLPTGPLGKPLRSGVAELFGLRDLDHAEKKRLTVAPRNNTEQEVAALWAAMLATEIPGVHHHFFELGGDSLLAKSLLLRVRETWGVEVPFIEFFDALTVAEQAALVSRLIEEGAEATTAPEPIATSDPAEPFPLSRAQERLWILEQIQAGQADYHIPLSVGIEGTVEIDRLEAAFTLIVRRHETLRTAVLGMVGEIPMQQVRAAAPVRLRRDELPANPAAVRARLDAHFVEPFELASGELMRALLLSRGREHILSVVIHHIAGDGRSLETFSQELGAAYAQAGNDVELPALTAQYRDFVAWERQRRVTEGYEHELDKWSSRLGPPWNPLQLPYDRAPDSPPGGPAQSVAIPLEQVPIGGLRSLSRQTAATPFMVLLAGFAAALSELAGNATVTIGTPSEDRVWPPSLPLIGYFVNTLPLRIDCGGAPTFVELVRRVRSVALDAYQGAEVSFDDIVARVNPPRNPSHAPLYDVMFTAAVGASPTPTIGGATVHRRIGSPQRTKSSLELDMRVLDGEVVGALTYDTRWFDHGTAQNMAALVGSHLHRGIGAPTLGSTL